MGLLTIGQVAKQTGVKVETIRFYEREGLIGTPLRSDAGYRQYQDDVVRRIRFIKRAKDLGFTLKEVAELLSLQAAPDVSCADIKARAQGKITDIEERIRILGRMKRALERLAAECSGNGPVTECPILGALDPDEEPQHVER